MLLACAAALLCLAGCGDDEEAADDRPAGAETATTATQDAPTAAACDLLTAEEVEAHTGPDPSVDPRTGETLDGFDLSQCVWSARGGRVGVAVVGSTERYELHDSLDRGERVRGLGDGAVVEPGTSLEDRGDTEGRTAFVLDGRRTRGVALDTGDERPAVDEVAELARRALERLR